MSAKIDTLINYAASGIAVNFELSMQHCCDSEEKDGLHDVISRGRHTVAYFARTISRNSNLDLVGSVAGTTSLLARWTIKWLARE